MSLLLFDATQVADNGLIALFEYSRMHVLQLKVVNIQLEQVKKVA